MIVDQQIKQGTILIVDDNNSNIMLLERILRQDGYSNIDTTTDPEKGVQLFLEKRYDLLLLDLNMPKLDGFGVMRQLKAGVGNDWVPVIVVTAQTDAPAKIRALSLGARDFIAKPIERLETLNRIKNVIETRLMHKHIMSQNKDLEFKIKARTEELENAQSEVLRRLGVAAEYRDNETGSHLIRMSKYCKAIALAYGLPNDEAELILYASPMHDIGKIGIADSILLKKGKLTEAEYEEMKQHTIIGAKILGENTSPILRIASQIAISHHEKWDGTGYPYGLQKEEIPLYGRIVAIADVFDALTSIRPYKRAWSNEEAVKYIIGISGKHFDPSVVAAFLKCFAEIEEIQLSHRDLL